MYPIKLYIRNAPNLIMIGFSVLLNIITWIWLLWQIHPQADQIFLRYNILFGVSYTGYWWQILYIPIIGFCILLANAVIGWLKFGEDKFIAQFLNFISVFCQIFLFIASALLVYLNV